MTVHAILVFALLWTTSYYQYGSLLTLPPPNALNPKVAILMAEDRPVLPSSMPAAEPDAAPKVSPGPPPVDPTRDVESRHLRASTEKLELEIQQLKRSLWQRPEFWTSAIPVLIAFVLMLLQWKYLTVRYDDSQVRAKSAELDLKQALAENRELIRDREEAERSNHATQQAFRAIAKHLFRGTMQQTGPEPVVTAQPDPSATDLEVRVVISSLPSEYPISRPNEPPYKNSLIPSILVCTADTQEIITWHPQGLRTSTIRLAPHEHDYFVFYIPVSAGLAIARVDGNPGKATVTFPFE